ncbi:Pyruvate dehydrogenase E1 component [Raoultella ornithinolytica]|nr:Pyruvate dehydrogenase E1 component [Raoultella ornithinolytica]
MKRVPLVWKACSVRLVSTARTASSTPRRTVSRLLYYKEDEKGQILQEGINELGAGASWLAAATSYSTNNLPMIPFYIYYSMFGFQRIGDLLLAGRRPAGSRLPGRRDFRSYHAERRRSAARRWSQPYSVSDYPELYLLRSVLRVRSCGHHARWSGAYVR